MITERTVNMMEENIEIISVKNLGGTLPIKFLGYKYKKMRVKRCFPFNKVIEIECCVNVKTFICPSKKIYKFIINQTQLIPVKDAEFLLRFKDSERNYCFEVDM